MDNIVINLSNEEIPASFYLYLAKRLGFVPGSKVDPDLKYETLEFIWKIEWEAFSHLNPEVKTTIDPLALHKDIKISNPSQVPVQHPVLDEWKTNLLGWIVSHKPTTPESNLTLLELGGRKWLNEKLESRSLFVTKFEKVETTADQHLLLVRNKVNTAAITLQQYNIIS